MKKSEQVAINEQVLTLVNDFKTTNHYALNWRRLRSCSAEVAQIDNWYVLCSYNTIVAIIDTQTDTLYDFLRYVYGYTATSAQHIRKFSKDYGRGKWGCANVLTYHDV